jgi:hypothetical protein
MLEASGENVATTEVNTAGRSEVSDIMASLYGLRTKRPASREARG